MRKEWTETQALEVSVPKHEAPGRPTEQGGHTAPGAWRLVGARAGRHHYLHGTSVHWTLFRDQ